MATITSAATGDWGTGATWVGGVAPADNDTVVIATGHTVTFNVDQSAFPNGIAGITVTGTLSLTRTAGTYYLKIKAATTIAGAGTFDCGTSGSPIPFAVKHTITGGAGWYIQGSGGLTMTVYAAEPTIKHILLSGDEAAGQTILSVGTDVTGDIWADGDTIHINDINKARENEERVIAAGGIAAGTITVTAGLTAAKSTGAVVALVSRNVKFIGVGNVETMKNFASGKLTIAGGSYTANASYCPFGASTGITVSGGAFYTMGYIFNVCVSSVVSGGVFSGISNQILLSSNFSTISGGLFTGSGTSVYTSNGVSISGGSFIGNTTGVFRSYGLSILGGTFSGNTNGVNECAGAVIYGGTFTGNTYGIANSSAIIKNGSFSTNTYDIYRSQIVAFNTLLASTENLGYTELSRESYSESIDHDQTAGAFRAWTKGGITASVATPLPTGYASANQITLADASNEGFWQKEYTVGAGASVNITMNLRKSASMTYLPRCIVFNKAATDPFAGGAGISTFTMTDSVDTFEESTYTYYNATANDVTLVIRFQGKNASGTVTTTLLVEQINVDLTTLINNLATVDTVVDAIKAKTDNLPSDPADQSAVEAAITAGIATIDTDSVLSAVVEGAYTVQDIFKLMASVMAGKVTGGGTTTVTFRDLSDALDRVTATVDSNGNRTATTLDLT